MTADHLYVIGTGQDNRAKIGRTKRTAKQRLRELQTGNPETLQILAWHEGLGDMEPRLHEYYTFHLGAGRASSRHCRPAALAVPVP